MPGENTQFNPGSEPAPNKQKAYYAEVFSGDLDEQWERAPGKNVILSALRHYVEARRIPRTASIIDIGCGTGFLLYRIRDEIPNSNFSLYGVDFSREAIEKAMNRFPGATFFCEDGAHTHVEAESMDVGIAYGSFEHFPNPQNAVQELARILKRGGLFFCMMPALGIDRTDRSDEGWYEERAVPGSPIRQCQWNLYRQSWERYFAASGLTLFPAEHAAGFGAQKPGVFFLGSKG